MLFLSSSYSSPLHRRDMSLFPSLSSFRPSLPKKRLGIYLIDRFTAPEDILSVTVYVYIYISFLSSLGQSCRRYPRNSRLERVSQNNWEIYIFFMGEDFISKRRIESRREIGRIVTLRWFTFGIQFKASFQLWLTKHDGYLPSV